MSAPAPPLPWEIVVDRIQKRLADKIKALETVQPDGLTKLQGEIAGLRWLLGLPEEIQRDREIAMQAGQPGY